MNHEKSMQWKVKFSYFFIGIVLLCLSYALFEYFFIPYGALAADEFVFARHIYEYTFSLPYRDFPPYKSVLGYYLLSLPLFFSHSLLQPLFYIKAEIALINLICIALSAYFAAAFFNKKAILLTLFFLLANQLFLLNGTDLRVDMLTSWLCLFSALFILQKRFHISGWLIGIAFLISQKALWYFLAINGAMLISYFAYASTTSVTTNGNLSFSRHSFLNFNTGVILPVVCYFLFWSFMASPSVVLYSLFYEAYLQAKINWYMPIYNVCWLTILYYGPLLFFLWPLTLISLCKEDQDQNLLQKRIFIMSFASIALLLFIQYKQPFPYNFVFTIPAFFLLYAEFITWLYQQKANSLSQEKMTNPLIIVLCLYTICIFLVVNIFSLPIIYNLLAILPFFIILYLYKPSYSPSLRSFVFYIICSLFIVVGIIYPLSQSIHLSLMTNGQYQRDVMNIAANLIEEEGDYLSGVPFFYQKDQTISGMKNLIGPELAYIYHPYPDIEPLLIPSLYLAPINAQMALEELEKKPIKLIINNYRVYSLPLALKNYIWTHYKQYYGSILLYAPTIFSKQLTFYLKFAGEYRLETKPKTRVTIDGKKIAAGKIIHLKKGDHLTDAKKDYRLVFIPKKEALRMENHEQDHWLRMLKPILGILF